MKHLTLTNMLFALMVAASMVILPSLAQAGGLWWPGIGAKGIAHGDAFVVFVDDATALWYNPAQMLNAQKLLIQLDGTVSHLTLDYERSSDFVNVSPVSPFGVCEFGQRGENGACPADPYHLPFENEHNYKTVHNNFNGWAQPVLGMVWNALGVLDDNLRVGFIWHGMNIPSIGFPKDAPTRYQAFEQVFQDQVIGLGVAYGFLKKRLRIGAALQMHVLYFRRNYIANLSNFDQLCKEFSCEDPTDENCTCSSEYVYFDEAYDARAEAEGLDFTASGNFGISGSPYAGIWLSASVQTPYEFSATGTYSLEQPAGYMLDTDFIFTGDKAAISFQMPWVFRSGLGYQHQYFTVEIDYTYEGWQSLERFKIQPKNANLTINGQEFVLPDQKQPAHKDSQLMQQTHRIATGMSFTPLPESNMLTFRIGGFYETGAVADRMVAATYIDGDKWSIASGFTFREKWIEVTGAFAYYEYRPQYVREGAVFGHHPVPVIDINTGQLADDKLLSVNNGRYKASAWLLSVGLIAHIDI